MENIVIEGLDQPASRIALGTWAIGGWMWGGSDESDAIKTIQAALDLGVNMIDTAPVYGFGRAEEIVGKALQGRAGARRSSPRRRVSNGATAKFFGIPPRRGCALSSKLAPQASNRGRRSLSGALAGWGRPHRGDRGDPRELPERGKNQGDRRQQFLARPNGSVQVGGAAGKRRQPPYNLFERAIEQDILPYAQVNGLAILAYGALCRGLLAGKISEETTYEGDDLRKSDPKFQPPRLQHYLSAVRRTR